MTPPIPLAGQIHLAMRTFATSAGTARKLPTHLHVGTPAGPHLSIPEQRWYDAGLRADLVVRALDGLDVPDPCCWVTRPGELVANDVDVAWLSAARAAFARHAVALPGFFVVTRRGWMDLTTQQVHQWDRVRPLRR